MYRNNDRRINHSRHQISERDYQNYRREFWKGKLDDAQTTKPISKAD